jgi:hypothetical protein
MTPFFRFCAAKNLIFLHRLVINRTTVLASEMRKASQVLVTQTMIVKSKDLSLRHDPAKYMLGAGTEKVIGVFPYRRDLRPRTNWNYWNGWNHWNRLLLS